MTRVFERTCPQCQGDLLFANRLEGATLQCLQCKRSVSPAMAREMLGQQGHREDEAA